MVTVSEFFHPSSLRVAAIRYTIVTACRYSWAYFISQPPAVLDILHPFHSRQLEMLLYAISNRYMPLGFLVSIILWTAQIVLIWRAARLLMKRPDATKPEQLRAGSWLSTPLLLSLFVIVTCCIIGWMIQTGFDLRFFIRYMLYFSSLPAQIGLGLSLLGFLYGGRFVAGAKASVGGMFGVRYLPTDHPLSQRVAKYAQSIGISHAPVVGIVDVMNAFAMGTHKDSAVVLGQPLMNILTEEELDAVIGHELGHVYHNDMNRMQFAEGFQRMLGNLISATTIMAISVLSRNRSDAMLGRAVGTLLRETVFVGSELVVKGISRGREYHADAMGARVASPAAMIGALQKIHGLPTRPTKLETQYGYLMFRGTRFGAWFSTHPVVEKRIKALQILETKAPEHPQEVEAVLSPQIDAMATNAAAALGTAYGVAKTGLLATSTALSLKERGYSAGQRLAGLAEKLPDGRSSLRIAVIVGLGLGALLLIVPAVYDHYKLDEKTSSLRSLTWQAFMSAGAFFASLPNQAVALLTDYDEQLATKTSQLQERQTQIDSLNRSLGQLRNELASTKASKDKLQDEVTRLANENTRLADGRDAGKAAAETIARLTAEINRQENLVVSLKRQLAQSPASPSLPSSDQSVATIDLLRNRNAALTAEVGMEVATITALRQENEALSSRIKQLEGQPSATNQGTVLSAPMAQTWLAAAVDTRGAVYVRGPLETEGAAGRSAMDACRGSGRPCQLVGVYENTCFAVSRPRGQGIAQNWWEATGPNLQQAQMNANRRCEAGSMAASCEVRVSVCAPDSRKTP